jgi:glutamyl-tRNA reductase
MGAGVVGALRARPGTPGEIILANRTPGPARAVADSVVDGRVEVVALNPPDYLERADVVIAAVRAPEPLIGPGTIESRPADRPLVVVDLGVPRNVAAGLGARPGVTLIDMDDLRDSVGSALDDRRAEVGEARAIVAAEVRRYQATRRARGAAPVVAALRSRLESARTSELDRRRSQFGELSEADWAQVDAVTRSVLAKVLHEPSVVLKETAGTARGERLVEALRTLFDL